MDFADGVEGPIDTSATEAAWFDHPRQLKRLFTTEMWERFGYYGMRAILTLYLAKHFLFSDTTTAGLYGGFTALVYLTPLIGGLIADNYLGSKRSVKFGAIMMSVGYFVLAFSGTGDVAKPFATVDGQRYEITVQGTGETATKHIMLAGQDLTIKGNTHPVTLKVVKYGEFNDPNMMGHRIGYSAETKINRKDFGMTFSMMLDGKFIVSDEVKIFIEGEFVEQKQEQ